MTEERFVHQLRHQLPLLLWLVLVWMLLWGTWSWANLLSGLAFVMGLGSACCFALADRWWLVAGALQRPPLGLGTAQGGEDAGRALPLAVLVAHLVALVRVAGRGWDNRDPGHYHASVSQVTG